MAITYQNQDCDYLLTEKRRIAAWISDSIEDMGRTPGDITFIFCSACYHREMNNKYLGHDYNTDVITFGYSENDCDPVSGDIFIDPETVAENAKKYETTTRLEMLRVLIHGVLHLCGYDDHSEEDQKTIRQKEDYYLERF